MTPPRPHTPDPPDPAARTPGMETEDPHIPDAETRKLQRYRRIWALVGTIPAGEVATYGQIAFVN